MSPAEKPVMQPANYLSRADKEVSSFELMKFIECLHLVRGRLTGPEASLLHCLIMRGWTHGRFRVSQSLLSLQSGLTTRTISRILKSFEAEGLIRRHRRRNQTSEVVLQECRWTEDARYLFRNDELRERAVDQFIQRAWRHSRPPSEREERARRSPRPDDKDQATTDQAHQPAKEGGESATVFPEPWSDADYAEAERAILEHKTSS